MVLRTWNIFTIKDSLNSKPNKFLLSFSSVLTLLAVTTRSYHKIWGCGIGGEGTSLVSRLISSALAAVMEHSSSSTLQGAQAVGTVPWYKAQRPCRICCVCWTEPEQHPDKSKRKEGESITADCSFLLFKWRNCWCTFLLFSIQYSTPCQTLLHEGIHPFQRSVFSARMAGGLQNTLGRHWSIILCLCQSQRLLFLLWKEH